MTLLAHHFPRTSRLAHVPLAGTTPVENLPNASAQTGSALWVKRDDQTSELYGGNKVRKLEFLLADARRQGCDTLVTTGAYGSHHVLATSLFGARWGFDVHAVVVPQPWTEHARENLRVALGAGTKLHRVPGWPMALPTLAGLKASLQMRGKRVYRIPHGGSSVEGALGYVEAGLELAKQIDTGAMPEPSAIYVALGSGGTCAGLAVGLAAVGLTTPVIGVRVTPRLVCNRATVGALVGGAVRTLRAADKGFPEVTRGAMRLLRIDASVYGDGYGVVDGRTADATKRAALDGLTLDPTYTAKTFAAFLRDASEERRGQTLLYWHTLSSADLSKQIEHAPQLDLAFG